MILASKLFSPRPQNIVDKKAPETREHTEQLKKNVSPTSKEMQRAETNRKEEFERLKKQLRDDNIKIYDEDDELILPRPGQTADKNAPIKARAFQSYKVNQHQAESFEIKLPRTCGLPDCVKCLCWESSDRAIACCEFGEVFKVRIGNESTGYAKRLFDSDHRVT